MNYEFLDNVSMSDNGNVVNEFDAFINNNPYNGFDVLNGNANMNYQNNKSNINLFNPYEGYLKGNAFKDEYKPYKNYKVAKLNINSEKEEMLIAIGECSFMMHDLNLYLDVHPDDMEALNKFSMYREKTNELITNYERKYGPICVKGEIPNKIPFAWQNNNWPWVK